MPPSDTEPFEVAGIGMACVLIHTRVFRKVRQKFGNNFFPIGYNSEDTSFMWKARKCGFKIFVDPTIPIGHVGQYVFRKDTIKQ
jgi:GT2 family glycosyltransferase